MMSGGKIHGESLLAFAFHVLIKQQKKASKWMSSQSKNQNGNSSLLSTIFCCCALHHVMRVEGIEEVQGGVVMLKNVGERTESSRARGT